VFVLWLSGWPDTTRDPETAGAHRMTIGISLRAALRSQHSTCLAAHAPTHQRRGGCDDRPSESDHPWTPTPVAVLPLPPCTGSIKAKTGRLGNGPEAAPHSPKLCLLSSIIISVSKTYTGFACDTVQAAQREHTETNHCFVLAVGRWFMGVALVVESSASMLLSGDRACSPSLLLI
jgi:hypothetical protein